MYGGIMEKHLRLKGQYELEIQFNNMFTTTNVKVTYYNMIVDNGLHYLVNSWLRRQGVIDTLIVGKNTENNRSDYTIQEFVEPWRSTNGYTKVENNKFIMELQNLDGKNINNTTEIGLIAHLIDEETGEVTDETVLISRTRHLRINIPENCILNLRYILSLDNSDESMEDCEEDI